MSFMDGIIEGRQERQKSLLNQLTIGEKALSIGMGIQKIKAQKEVSSLWQQYDPSDPVNSLGKIASSMGEKGDTEGAVKLLGSAEQMALRQQQQLKYQSDIEHQRAQEAYQERQSLIKEADEARKEKDDERKVRRDEAREQDFLVTNARLTQGMMNMERARMAHERVAEQRIGIMMGNLGLSQKREARQAEEAVQRENHRAEAEREKVAKDHLAQENLQAKLRGNQQKLAIPDKSRTDAAKAVLDRDERTQHMPMEWKDAAAKSLAAEAGKSIAKNLSKETADWEPEDFDKAIMESLEGKYQSGQWKEEETSGFLGFGKKKVTKEVSRRDTGQQPIKQADKPSTDTPKVKFLGFD